MSDTAEIERGRGREKGRDGRGRKTEEEGGDAKYRAGGTGRESQRDKYEEKQTKTYNVDLLKHKHKCYCNMKAYI